MHKYLASKWYKRATLRRANVLFCMGLGKYLTSICPTSKCPRASVQRAKGKRAKGKRATVLDSKFDMKVSRLNRDHFCPILFTRFRSCTVTPKKGRFCFRELLVSVFDLEIMKSKAPLVFNRCFTAVKADDHR